MIRSASSTGGATCPLPGPVPAGFGRPPGGRLRGACGKPVGGSGRWWEAGRLHGEGGWPSPAALEARAAGVRRRAALLRPPRAVATVDGDDRDGNRPVTDPRGAARRALEAAARVGRCPAGRARGGPGRGGLVLPRSPPQEGRAGPGGAPGRGGDGRQPRDPGARPVPPARPARPADGRAAAPRGAPGRQAVRRGRGPGNPRRELRIAPLRGDDGSPETASTARRGGRGRSAGRVRGPEGRDRRGRGSSWRAGTMRRSSCSTRR